MKKRIFIYSLLVTVVGLLLFVFIVSDLDYKENIKLTSNYLKVYTNLFDESKVDDEGYVNKLSSDMGDAFVSIIYNDGVIIADSHNSNSVGETISHSTEVLSILKKGDGGFTAYNDNGKHCLYYCKKFTNCSLVVSVGVKTEVSALIEVLPTALGIFAFEVLLCLIFSYFCTSFILRPVEDLAKKGSINKKIETKYEELQPFVDVMNKKNDEINEKIKEVKGEKELVLKATYSKNEFISNITHEMNTPLTSIKGFAELLQTDNLNKEQRDRAIKTILSQSERLTGLIACIINYNELDNDDLPSYEVNISKIAEETAEILRPQMEKRNITLVKDIDEDVFVSSRHERVNEILGNLIRNAIKYNKDYGTIEIIIRSGSIPYLIVRDTGIGVAEENKEKIFDRFFTVDKSHGGKNGGFGLGLAVVKKICKRSGWILAVESKLGEGTSFIIEFSQHKL